MRRIVRLAISLAGVAVPVAAYASSVQVNAEGVNVYPNGDQRHGADEVNSFMFYFIGPGPWTVGNYWNDGNVFDLDFVDSDLNANGDDLVSFDPQGLGSVISYYAGSRHLRRRFSRRLRLQSTVPGLLELIAMHRIHQSIRYGRRHLSSYPGVDLAARTLRLSQ
ncbi:MAG TPA: hypothetical protein VKU41_03875 [Polyangiaceae bacterium]|nr:hypothetical protein [Polyangiaceae bacterium]